MDTPHSSLSTSSHRNQFMRGPYFLIRGAAISDAFGFESFQSFERNLIDLAGRENSRF